VLVAVGVANGNDQLADVEPIRVAHAGHRKAAGVRFDHGQVGIRVVTHQESVFLRAVEQRHPDFFGSFHDVAVGKDESVGREDETRTRAGRYGFAPLGLENVYFDDGIFNQAHGLRHDFRICIHIA
jgi:hypothetical protein